MASNDNLEEGEPINSLEVPLIEGDQQQDPDFRRVHPAERDQQQPDPGFRRVHPADRDLYHIDRDQQQDPDFHRIHPADRDMYPADLAARDQQLQDADFRRDHPADMDPQARRRGLGNAEAQDQPQELPRVGQFDQKKALELIFGILVSFMAIIVFILFFLTFWGI